MITGTKPVLAIMLAGKKGCTPTLGNGEMDVTKLGELYCDKNKAFSPFGIPAGLATPFVFPKLL